MEKLAIEPQMLTEIELCVNKTGFEARTFSKIEHFFKPSKQLKMIRLKFETNTFESTNLIYNIEIENVCKFLQRMTDGGTSKWCMNHYGYLLDTYFT